MDTPKLMKIKKLPVVKPYQHVRLTQRQVDTFYDISELDGQMPLSMLSKMFPDILVANVVDTIFVYRYHHLDVEFCFLIDDYINVLNLGFCNTDVLMHLTTYRNQKDFILKYGLMPDSYIIHGFRATVRELLYSER